MEDAKTCDDDLELAWESEFDLYPCDNYSIAFIVRNCGERDVRYHTSKSASLPASYVTSDVINPGRRCSFWYWSPED
ncbi:hypothetical protein GOBAR_DD03450 [Gossypium barbadense]|nr:hypothetical protein GOBAR_DD03450 [Gossypium barbadense]